MFVVQDEQQLVTVIERVIESVMKRAPASAALPEYLTHAQVSAQTGYSPSAVASWVRKGLLQTYGAGKVRWSEVQALMASGALRRKPKKDAESRAEEIVGRKAKR